MATYYNEHEPFAAEWLRNLIAAGHIAAGVVDERDITDVTPNDLKYFTQHHFFAGVGIWSAALRAAGWPDNRPIWTGSCPCQPFSQAGTGVGFDDKRHVWPAWYWLITQCRPATIIGEQVASKSGLAWFDLVQADLEGTAYAVGAVDMCAAGIGAPHIRQRLWFVANSHSVVSSLADTNSNGRKQGRLQLHAGQQAAPVQSGHATWDGAGWIDCSDGKQRPIEPGTFPLVNGYPDRVGRLRAYGNALCLPLATQFIKSIM